MDNREMLSLQRWIEVAETEIAELASQREASRRSAGMEIVVNAQLVAARRRLQESTECTA